MVGAVFVDGVDETGSEEARLEVLSRATFEIGVHLGVFSQIVGCDRGPCRSRCPRGGIGACGPARRARVAAAPSG